MKIREALQTSRLMTVQQAAKQLLVEDKSVRRWLKTGKLKGYKLPGGDWRIDIGDLESILHSPDFKTPTKDERDLGFNHEVQPPNAKPT